MATYVNDLRLKEISTGDESGTWGTSTNTNLELIGEALGYATQQVFSSDADATTTVADGASDPARAMYFKITSAGNLTATRTCTIAPNTVSRVMFIENATSGSQSIAISQGSGANVTIATGKTAVVYLDGAGSGAAVVDAMAGVDPGVTDTLAEVLVAGNATGGTDIAVGTGDDITFADSSKAIFGAGSDLQIYHDGTNSYISDQGTNDLKVLATDFQLKNAADDEFMMTAVTDGAVTAYHNGSAKLATTATGIDVTGTVVADVLTIQGSAQNIAQIETSGTTGSYITFRDADTTAGQRAWLGADADLFKLYSNNSTLNITMKSDGSNNGLTGINNANPSAALDVAGTIRLNGNVGIGVIPESWATYTPIQVQQSSLASFTNGDARLTNNGYYSSGWKYIDSRYATQYLMDASNGIHTWSTAASGTADGAITWSERFRIDNSGDVFVKNGGQLKIERSGQSNFTAIYTDTGDSTVINNSWANKKLILDRNGNLLVGKMSAGSDIVGFQVLSTGKMSATVSGDETARFNRTTSDGDIVEFRKDDTTVGSIATEGGDLAIGNDDVGLQFINGGQTVRGFNMATNTRIDAQVDLGMSTTRFKDLYLSGGAYLGGTGSANYLDDYEEGTFTPTVFGSTTAGTTTYLVQAGNYTKIGRMVHITLIVQYSSATGTGTYRIGGLPFSSDNGLTENYSVGSMLPSQINWTGGSSLIPLQFQGTNFIIPYYVADDAGAGAQQMVNESANTRISLTYYTSA